MNTECKGCRFLGPGDACQVEGLETLCRAAEITSMTQVIVDFLYSESNDPRSKAVKLANYLERDVEEEIGMIAKTYGEMPTNQEGGKCKKGDMQNCNRYEERKISWLDKFLNR